MRFTLGLAAVLVAAVAASCSENTPEATTTPPAVDAGGPSLATPALPCTDAVEAIYADPGALVPDANARGNVLKCAKAPDVSKEEMQAKLSALGGKGRPLTSSAHVYKISYRTERGDTAGTPAVSSALVYIPETPRADKLPIVVGARGSRGQAARCAVSMLHPSLPGINDDAYRMVYALVGYGYAVIVPDLAGYTAQPGLGGTASGYAQATDVARSTLDGGRALKKLFPALDAKRRPFSRWPQRARVPRVRRELRHSGPDRGHRGLRPTLAEPAFVGCRALSGRRQGLPARAITRGQRQRLVPLHASRAPRRPG
jgi:hypothetical protein